MDAILAHASYRAVIVTWGCCTSANGWHQRTAFQPLIYFISACISTSQYPLGVWHLLALISFLWFNKIGSVWLFQKKKAGPVFALGNLKIIYLIMIPWGLLQAVVIHLMKHEYLEKIKAGLCKFVHELQRLFWEVQNTWTSHWLYCYIFTLKA